MLKKRHPFAGARPGTLLIPEDAVPTRIHLLQYSAGDVWEEEIQDVEDIAGRLDDQAVTWIDVQGLGDASVLQSLLDLFDVHPLAREAVVNVPQRPKTEIYGEQQTIICRVVRMAELNAIEYEQVSIILGPNYVLTIQENYSDLLEPIRRRARSATTRLRQSDSGYLAYAVLDTVVDAYYPVLETIGEHLEQLEELIIQRPEPRMLRQLNSLRTQLAHLRRAVWPKRELVRSLMHDDNPLIGDQVSLFLRDTYDHTIQVSDAVDMCREMVTGLLNTYLSAVGQRTNEVMKVLTILSSIFVPLTFIAGIYGMNFQHMPELAMRWGYPAVWCLMLGSVSGMLFYFRRKGWIGNPAGGELAPLPVIESSHRVVAGEQLGLETLDITKSIQYDEQSPDMHILETARHAARRAS